MTDWEKLKVAELKEELKSRGIPLTGLKLKQQLIDRLNELDSNEVDEADTNDEKHNNHNSEGDGTQEEGPAEPQTVLPSVSHDSEEQGAVPGSRPSPVDAHTSSTTQLNGDALVTKNGELGLHARKGTQDPSHPIDRPTSDERVDKLPDELPIELKQEESQARDGTTPPPAEAADEKEAETLNKDDPFVPQEIIAERQWDDTEIGDAKASLDEKQSTDNGDKPQPSDQAMQVSATSAVDIDAPAKEPLRHQPTNEQKRKRSRMSPADDMTRKKPRVDEGASTVAQGESNALERIQEVTDAAQAVRSSDNQMQDIEMGSANQTRKQDIAMLDGDQIDDRSTPTKDRMSRNSSRLVEPSSPSGSSPERDVAPAMHPATRSLYIRNLKRPLHIPSLRNHISSLAGTSDNNTLEEFYLDNIRTHAFVSLLSISAASRVRNAMHDSRFPDEPMRQPLWIDFVPDEKVRIWINQETGANNTTSGVGGRSSKKFEVVYTNHESGIEAELREVSSTIAQSQRPELQASRSNRMVSQDPSASAAVASGIHPSRTSLVPASAMNPHVQQQSKARPNPSDPGKGFRALDELFSSTAAKPKLYFKLPTQSLVDDRLDMIRGLRVNHTGMGKSGDDGMKRYSFEKDERNGREEWVDKGPEFGFGRRGQERLTGYGTVYYGGGRGRGGFRGGRRGGDSWRGR